MKKLTDKSGNTHLISDDELELIDCYNMSDDMTTEKHIKIHKLLNKIYINEIINEIIGDLMLPPEKITLLQFIEWSKVKETTNVFNNNGRKHFLCRKCREELIDGIKVNDLTHRKQGLCEDILLWGS